jgi:ABC-type branched-subunit amino acid transport system permease subunit
MAVFRNSSVFLSDRSTRLLLIKWIVAVLVPIAVFTFVWGGEAIINAVIAPASVSSDVPTDTGSLIQAAIFIVIFYTSTITLVGYLVAADSGRRRMIEIWIDSLIFAVIPLILVVIIGDLFFTLSISAVIWILFFVIRNRVRNARHLVPPPPLENLNVINAEQRVSLVNRGTLAGFLFATLFALVWLILDVIYYFAGQLTTTLLIWAAVRTLLLPLAGYLLGRLGGGIAARRTIAQNGTVNNVNSTDSAKNTNNGMSKRRQLAMLSTTRAREEAKDLVPNDLPLRSKGAQRFYILLLLAFLVFYPVIDPFLFGTGTSGRLASYGDAGRYVILALGLNIVVGFAGLLDLGYVAFFAIGAYTWSIVGSQQLHYLFNTIIVNPQVWPWFFWPMIIITALIAALWGVLLGAPTLRLRGDYLAIVTLGFGEIVPIVFLNLDKYTNGTNGIVGVYSPAFFGVNWSVSTPLPFYYLILALIALVLFANIRLRDSRLGRAWIAIREDEVAAASSGINLVRTKLFAFAAGAFFSGIAGIYYAAKLGAASPDNFSFSDSVIYLAMVVLGGLGSIPGVIVGALVVYAINVLVLAQLDTFASNQGSILNPIYTQIIHTFPNFSFSNIRNMIFGAVLIIIMIFRPEGLIPSARRRRELHQSEEQGEQIEVGALDVPPGAPGFESEVRVE